MKKSERLTNVTFSFAVEGECEQFYFEHLKALINSTPEKYRIATLCIKPNIKPKRDPSSCARAMSCSPWFAIYDIEDYNDDVQLDKFEKLIADIKKANTYIPDKKNYFVLGYTNYSFELWMCLHKRDMLSAKINRYQYLSDINIVTSKNYAAIDNYKSETEFKHFLKKYIGLRDVVFAIKKAKAIIKNNKDTNKHRTQIGFFAFYKDNPDLTIHKVVERILADCFGTDYQKVINKIS